MVETPDVKIFRLTFQDRKIKRRFCFKPGQFGKYTVFGEGESTFYLASSPTRKGYLECSVKKVGKITEALHFVPMIMREIDLSPEKALAITCGPAVMIKFVIEGLISLGFSPEQIITTLEMKIRCGLGKCGRCNIGKHYVCQDGPVFTYAQIGEFPNEF